ncbi:MAG: dihydroorotate dehydrogenase electron transfer subunit, partial [Planctomycetota bacterium]|nr:dihydroorotate dehydrogenase electron transfer subunit [Planctomycetota bacterium]
LPPVTWGPGETPALSQGELLGKETLLRRPLGLAGRRETTAGSEIDLIYRTIGTGTHWLARVGQGETLNLLGPLGNAFTIRPGQKRAALVGGGVGIPPMLYLAQALADAGVGTVAFNGARSANLLPLTILPGGAPADGRPARCVAEFADRGADAVVTTDDGSAGMKGFVASALEAWLKEAGAAQTVVYSCGPEAMMKAVAKSCAAAGVECQLALERYMGCGLGTCQSCAVKIRDDSPDGWSYKLCCTDGPVFDANVVIWR